MQKVNRTVHFTETLDLTQFLAQSKQKQQAECKYRLFAAIVHSGNKLSSGHYYAYVRAADGNWYEANDKCVTPVTLDQVLNDHPYVLFYQCLNLPIGKSEKKSARKGISEFISLFNQEKTLVKKRKNPERAAKLGSEPKKLKTEPDAAQPIKSKTLRSGKRSARKQKK